MERNFANDMSLDKLITLIEKGNLRLFHQAGMNADNLDSDKKRIRRSVVCVEGHFNTIAGSMGYMCCSLFLQGWKQLRLACCLERSNKACC